MSLLVSRRFHHACSTWQQALSSTRLHPLNRQIWIRYSSFRRTHFSISLANRGTMNNTHNSVMGKSPNGMFNNSGNGALQVPGYGLEINLELDADARFAHGIMDAIYERLTIRELAMLRLMNALTDKPNWQEKIFDENIVQHWREESLQMTLVSERTFEWCLTELRDKVTSNHADYVRTLDTASRCVKADNVIPHSLQSELRDQVQPLLDGPKDWHPGSNEQVLNLVHPSLFPLVYGKTRVLEKGQTTIDDVLAAPENTTIAPSDQNFEPGTLNGDRYSGQDTDRWSKRFQWLPCEVAFQGDTGTEVKIVSYINNLQPGKHAGLYGTIEKMIQYSVPAWNDVLLKGAIGRTPLRITTMGAELDPPERPDWIGNLAEDPDDENWKADVKKVKEYLELPDVPLVSGGVDRDSDDGPGDDENDPEWTPTLAAEWKAKRLTNVIHPEPGIPHTFDDWKHGRERHFASPGSGYSDTRGSRPPHTFYDVHLEKEYRTAGLQVIVKLASIELTPENPEYSGGNWHLEGMLNEHIVATSIYYFDVDNVSESRIRFRQEASLDDYEIYYEQDEHWPICDIFGVDSLRDEPAVQELGSIATPNGRLLVFPNTLQHKVEPFNLVDSSRPGHRRFLVLWLVDPNYRILSTRNVPPQQHEWWVEKAAQSTNLSARVPREVQIMIEEQLKTGTMTLDEAKAYRTELMAERTALPDAIEKAMEQYNFCEH